MPRLNINKEFGFGWSWYDDWHWCQDEEECMTKPLSGDSYPFRESFRTRQQIAQGWGFREDRYPRVQGKIIWAFLDRFLEGSIGKKFDEAYSKFCKIASKLPDKHYYFMREFESNRPYYFIDSDGLIQENNWWKRTHKKKEPYVFESADFTSSYFDKRTGVKVPKSYWALNGNHVSLVTSGYQVENVIPKSKLERRLIWEKIQKKRQLNKYWNKQNKLKEYSFLTREEEKLKKDKMGKGKPKWETKNKIPLEQQTVVTVTVEFNLFTVQDSGYTAEEFGSMIVKQIEKNVMYDESTWCTINEQLAKQIK